MKTSIKILGFILSVAIISLSGCNKEKKNSLQEGTYSVKETKINYLTGDFTTPNYSASGPEYPTKKDYKKFTYTQNNGSDIAKITFNLNDNTGQSTDASGGVTNFTIVSHTIGKESFTANTVDAGENYTRVLEYSKQ